MWGIHDCLVSSLHFQKITEKFPDHDHDHDLEFDMNAIYKSGNHNNDNLDMEPACAIITYKDWVHFAEMECKISGSLGSL